MKLLFINNDKGWGGGQEYLKDLTDELRKSGIEVHFVARAGSLSEERFRGLGVPGYTMPHHGIRDLKALWQLAAIMRRERFDVISINREHDLFCTVVARFLAFPCSRPGKLLMTYHIGVARRQFFLGSMDAILCVSEHVRTKLLQFHPQVASKTHILHNGIRLSTPPPSKKFASVREKRFFHGVDFPLIGMVGAFWKNQTELVDCIPFLRQEFPDIKVAFVGDNTEVELTTPLIEKIREMGLEDSIIFTGKVPRERLADVFSDLDLSVTTHRNEGFGIVHLESLAAGTPVVAFNEGGQVDILTGGEVGTLVEGGPKEFAAAVAGLLRDHDRRFNMGAKGHALVKSRFSVERMGENHRSFFCGLLQGE
jgi:glycosyltransferase involved in cell wall biosynthesis